MLETAFCWSMDATSPITARIAGQTTTDSGSFRKPIFAGGMLTLVDNLFVGRRRQLDCGNHRHHRYREHHYRSAEGHGHAS